MNVFEQIALGWQCLWHARREMPRTVLWAPWVVLFVLQALSIAALCFAAHPALSWFMAPCLSAWTHSDVLGYPELFRRLPELASRLALVLGWTVGSLVTGASVRLFAERYQGVVLRPASAWSAALSRWPALLLATAPGVLALFVAEALPGLLSGVRLSSLTRGLLPALCHLLAWMVSGLFVQAVVIVMQEGKGLRALAATPRTWRAGLIPGLLVLLLLAIPGLPIDRLLASSDLIVQRGLPELTAGVALARVAVDGIVGFLLTGSITLLHRTVLEEREETA